VARARSEVEFLTQLNASSGRNLELEIKQKEAVMKKHLAKTISVLSLFIILSVSAGNSLAGSCNTCKPTIQTSAAAAKQNAVLTLALNSREAENSFDLEFLLAQLAIGLLNLP
jgi:hypothetical protein